MENVMEIREDFKVDFDSWRKEAKQLCRKSVLFLLIFVFAIPFGVYCLMQKFQMAAPSLNFIHYPLAALVMLFFSLFTAFYTMFYFKRTDFGEAKNIVNIVRDIIYTYNNFVDYVKIHLVFFYIIGGLALFTLFISLFVTVPAVPKSYLSIFSSSMVGVYISFYLLISATQRYIFGLVYIGYGMVNREGASILTTQAYSKYPELQKYVFEKSAIFNMVYIFGWLFMIMSGNEIIRVALSCLFIGWSSYHVAIFYLISRDLYGGKKQTQKVTEKVDDIDALPNPI